MLNLSWPMKYAVSYGTLWSVPGWKLYSKIGKLHPKFDVPKELEEWTSMYHSYRIRNMLYVTPSLPITCFMVACLFQYSPNAFVQIFIMVKCVISSIHLQKLSFRHIMIIRCVHNGFFQELPSSWPPNPSCTPVIQCHCFHTFGNRLLGSNQ